MTDIPQVTIHEHAAATPSQTIARAANATATRTDKRGRRIVVKRFNALQFFRLTRILGDGIANSATMNLAMAAASVCAIDGDDETFPNTQRELESIIQRLDFDGLDAAGEALKDLSDDQGLDSAKN
jgi:hypothetical protein